MDDTRMFGYRKHFHYKKRCDFCHMATSNGYVVNSEHLRGFFCGAPHAQQAYKKRVEVAKEQGMQLEEE